MITKKHIIKEVIGWSIVLGGMCLASAISAVLTAYAQEFINYIRSFYF